MTSSAPAPRAYRRVGPAVLAALVLPGGVLLGVGPPGPSTVDARSGTAVGALREPGLRDHARPPGRQQRVPGGRHVLDEDAPTVARLDPALLGALRRAATAAAADGVELQVTSGWRSAAHQEQLLRDAVDEHGSAREAARWVATPETSAHVSGDAVDIGPTDAAAWLSEHGADHGLCQVYENEPWHFELRPDAVDDGCPAMYADPTRDPRMQR